MELARTHTTATEIEKQMKDRQKRLTDITLELAGDLDEQGEAELRSAVNSLDAKRVQTRRDVLDTFSNEAYLRGVVTKLREVTGVHDASDMVSWATAPFLLARSLCVFACAPVVHLATSICKHSKNSATSYSI